MQNWSAFEILVWELFFQCTLVRLQEGLFSFIGPEKKGVNSTQQLTVV